MTRIRRKGVAIVESNKGILLVSGKRKIFSFPDDLLLGINAEVSSVHLTLLNFI